MTIKFVSTLWIPTLVSANDYALLGRTYRWRGVCGRLGLRGGDVGQVLNDFLRVFRLSGAGLSGTKNALVFAVWKNKIITLFLVFKEDKWHDLFDAAERFSLAY